MDEYQFEDPNLEPQPNLEIIIEQYFPDVDLEEVNPLSVSDFLNFLSEFILAHPEDHEDPFNQPQNENDEVYPRPGFISIFSRKKINLGSMKRTFPEIREEADKVNADELQVLAGLLSTTFQTIKAELANHDKNARADALPDIVNNAFGALNARLAEITEVIMFKLVKKLCSRDAIYELMCGSLHRFDPVIGDRGCQWRAPFVLDLYGYIKPILDSYDDQELVTVALQEYAERRAALPSFREILETIEAAETGTTFVAKDESKPISKRNKKKVGIYVDAKVFNLWRKMKAFCNTIETQTENYTNIVLDIKGDIANWHCDDIPGFDALTFLRYCKLFTCNRIRTVDEFGLPGIEIELPFPGGESFLGRYLEAVSNYSMAYMTYVCEDACRAQGLTIGDDGYAVDENSPGTIHIMGSALKLMKDGRVTTLQKSTLYETNMCYGPTRAIFTRQALRHQPIIIDLRQLICTADETADGGYRFSYNGGDIYYYQPNDQDVFEHIPEDQLSDIQKSSLGLICEACCIVLEGGPVPTDGDDVFCSLDYDVFKTAVLNTPIIDLIMFGLSTHPEGPSQLRRIVDGDAHPISTEQGTALFNANNLMATGRAELPGDEVGGWVLANDRIPFPDATTPGWDLLIEKKRLFTGLQKFGSTSSFYRKVLPPNRVEADRNPNTMPFAPIHIYCSSYNNKIVDLQESLQYMTDNNVQGSDDYGHRRFRVDGCRPRADQ